MLKRSYKFKLYPNASQRARLHGWMILCQQLYNACLQQRIEAWKRQRKSIGRYDQQNQLPELRADSLEYKNVNAHILQDVSHRVDLAFKAFFRRIREGKKPGFPCFKSAYRYTSFTHPQAKYAKWRPSHLYIPSFGWVKWRPPALLDHVHKVKTITIKREPDGWYAVLSCEVPKPEALPATGNSIGIDLGLKNLVATSTGEVLGNLEHLKAAERRLRRMQRVVSRRKKGSNRRRKAVVALARRHQDLTRARKDQLHKISRKLVNENDVICIEDLNVQQLINLGANNAQGRGLRRNFRHAAFTTLIWMLTYKAEEAGRKVVKGTATTLPRW